MSLAHEDVVQEVPVSGAWVLPVPIESGILLEQGVDDYQSWSCTQLRQHAPLGVADADCMASQNSWSYSLGSFHQCIKVADDDELLPAVHFLVEWPLVTLEGLITRGICHECGSVHTDGGGKFTSLKDSAEGHKAIRVSYREACQLAGQCVLHAPCSVLCEWSLFYIATKHHWEKQCLLFVSFPVSHRWCRILLATAGQPGRAWGKLGLNNLF